MHTALVSRILRDRTLWEETTVEEDSETITPLVPVVAHSAV
jgi:hypothetical protein